MEKTLEKIIDYAARVTEAESIILFGSMVDEKFNIFSDVDLLIVSEGIYMKKNIAAMIECYSNELSLKADVLIYSRSEFERESQKPKSFIAAIIKSGKVVYEKKNLQYL